MSLDERSNVGPFCFCYPRVGDIEMICTDYCAYGYSNDGICQDGGSDSDYDDCAYGTDCNVGFHLTMTFQTIAVLCLI
jgi:hypothetical protein